MEGRDADTPMSKKPKPGFDHLGLQYRQRDSNPCYRRERAAS